ncbi:uncharacterized protein PRD47_019012 isoform 2-T2 [Ara ararauna]
MMMIPLPALSGLGRRIPLWNWASLVGRAGAGGSSWEANRMMDSGKRNADLDGWDAKIRRLKEDPEESDTELEECDTENGEFPPL